MQIDFFIASRDPFFLKGEAMNILIKVLLLLYVSCFSYAMTDDTNDQVQAETLNYSCGSKTMQGIPFSYCYRNAEATNNDDIIYFFHGLNGSAKTWFTQWVGTLMVQYVWQSKGYRPRIVSVSFGKEWLLVDNKKHNLLTLFSNQVMPFIEKKMGGLRRGQRHLIGQSMGGFSAAQIALKKPGLFSRVALLCPSITTIGPYASKREVDDYIYRTAAWPWMVRKMLLISRNIFSDKADWDKHDPLILLKRYRYTTKSKFYVSTGMWDGYGFQEGSSVFSRIAKARAFDTQWIPVPGIHCNFNRLRTANFIMGD